MHNKKSTQKLVNMEYSLHLTYKTFAPSVEIESPQTANASASSPSSTSETHLIPFLIIVYAIMYHCSTLFMENKKILQAAYNYSPWYWGFLYGIRSRGIPPTPHTPLYTRCDWDIHYTYAVKTESGFFCNQHLSFLLHPHLSIMCVAVCCVCNKITATI